MRKENTKMSSPLLSFLTNSLFKELGILSHTIYHLYIFYSSSADHTNCPSTQGPDPAPLINSMEF